MCQDRLAGHLAHDMVAAVLQLAAVAGQLPAAAEHAALFGIEPGRVVIKTGVQGGGLLQRLEQAVLRRRHWAYLP